MPMGAAPPGQRKGKLPPQSRQPLPLPFDILQLPGPLATLTAARAAAEQDVALVCTLLPNASSDISLPSRGSFSKGPGRAPGAKHKLTTGKGSGGQSFACISSPNHHPSSFTSTASSSTNAVPLPLPPQQLVPQLYMHTVSHSQLSGGRCIAVAAAAALPGSAASHSAASQRAGMRGVISCSSNARRPPQAAHGGASAGGWLPGQSGVPPKLRDGGQR